MKKTIVIVLAALIALSSLFAQGANEAASAGRSREQAERAKP